MTRVALAGGWDGGRVEGWRQRFQREVGTVEDWKGGSRESMFGSFTTIRTFQTHRTPPRGGPKPLSTSLLAEQLRQRLTAFNEPPNQRS